MKSPDSIPVEKTQMIVEQACKRFIAHRLNYQFHTTPEADIVKH